MRKYTIILMTSIFLLFSSNLASANTQATDDITGHYFENYMREAINLEILKGISEGVYNPDGDVTRSQFAALIVRTLEKQEKMPAATQSAISFSDVKEGEWYFNEVQKATSLGIINGYPDGTFAPDKAITRQEMAIMIIRTLNAQGVQTVLAKIKFTDLTNTHEMFLEAIKKVYGLGLMNGTSDTTFTPEGITTRGQAAAVLMRFFHLDPSAIVVDAETQFKVSRVSNDGTLTTEAEYTSFDEAKQNSTYGQVVVHKNEVVYMGEGYAYTTGFALVYDNEGLSKERTYLTTGTEVHYLDATEKAVKIKYGMHEGYISKSLVNLVPNAQVTNTSYYHVENGYLYHRIYDPVAKKYLANLEVSYAPSQFSPGVKYYSYLTNEFTDGAGNVYEMPLYFANLPLHMPTSYTAEQIDAYLLNHPYEGKTPLYGLGAVFKQIEAEYQVNALYLMAHAIHESAWGTSKIATDKLNLYGYKAYDSDAYNSAKTYTSFEESIRDAAIKVSGEYIINGGKYYYGAVLGNKSYGMNVKYASDALWGEKIAAHMFRADAYLGKQDYNKYKLGITLVKDLRVRDAFSATYSNTLLTMSREYVPFALVEGSDYMYMIDENGAQWFQVYTDNPTNRQGYIFGYGSLLGEYRTYAKIFTNTY